MNKLTILNADGSHYWTEHFHSQADAEAWIAEEQTRSNWEEGRTWKIEDLTPPAPARDLWGELRSERNARLGASDFSQLADIQAALSEAQKQAWIVYRQALRDLPENTQDPDNPTWPEAPT